MAKDVDLSSKEWRDLIFEGKNKEFGAYALRAASDRRHNRAVIYTIIGLAVLLVGAFIWGLYNDYRIEQKQAEILAAAAQAEMSALTRNRKNRKRKRKFNSALKNRNQKLSQRRSSTP